MRERWVDCRGLTIHVIERGPLHGRHVLLHHGFLDHARSWDPVAEALASDHRVFALDARGHGDSDPVGRGGYYYFQDYVSDLFDVATALAPSTPLVLVGHSMGGMVCSLFAGTFPDLAAALVSVEGAGPPARSPSEAPALMEEWIQGVRRVRAAPPRRMESLEEAAARLRAYNPRLTPERSLTLARHGTRDLPGGGCVWKFDPLHQTRTPQPFYLEQARAFWSRIPCPALRVSGVETPFRWEDAEDRESIPGARTARVPGAGHMVHHDQPEALARLIREFLHEVLPRRTG